MTIGLNVLAQTTGDREALFRHLTQTTQRTVLIMDEPDYALRLKLARPELRVIHRTYHPKDHEFHLLISPGEFLSRQSLISDRLLIQALNEPFTEANVPALVNWLVELMRIAPTSRRLVIGNFSMGNPHEDQIAAGIYDPLLRALAGSRHVLGLHEYWKHSPTDEPWHVGRFQHWLVRADRIGVRRPTIIITEHGRDIGGGHDGWRAAGYSEEQYADMVIAADQQYYAQHDMDALVFCYGTGADGRWNTFNVEGARTFSQRLTDYNQTAATLPPTPVPTPPDPAELGAAQPGVIRWTATNEGVNLRSVPSLQAPIVRTLRVGQEVDFRPKTWLSGGHQWRRLENPAGWVSENVCDVVPRETAPILRELAVPYRSQQGVGAGRYGNDCGPACANMLLQYFWTRAGFREMTALSVDDMSADSGLVSGDAPQSIASIIALLGRYGITAQARRPFTRADVVREIDSGRPTISLVRYRHLNPGAGVDFGHYVVPVAYSSTGMYVHDPLHGGARFFVANAQFDLALSDLGSAGLPNQSIVVVQG